MTSERRRLEAAAPELSEELRRLRELNRLTLAALAKRTNYSKSSWERYLNGKVIPPESAVLAFARTVGARPDELLMLRNRAERAERTGPGSDVSGAPGPGASAPGVPVPGASGPRTPAQEGAVAAPGRTADGEAGGAAGPGAGAGPGAAGAEARWAAGGSPAGASAPAPDAALVASGSEPSGPRKAASWPWRKGLVLAGIASLGAAVGLAVGIPMGTERGDRDEGGALAGTPVSSEVVAGGPGCIGSECREKDPQRLNCHLGVWTAAAVQRGDTYLELRYSPGCRSAWARITEAGVGDVARVVTERGVTQERAISYDGDTYSPMVEAPYPAAVRACAKLLDGQSFCTAEGGARPLREAVTDENERG
ncbi:helix-turn-helix domain-containing protein [Streptomyces sp. NPDC007346]|uniref:helix-turn-helix domain-containing protein n=1 Tax=Streptomyces sp. NPDC007346 TaxID=3154682 RepID=UPI003455FE0D